ncbi:MAG: RluA family pseudouridine synthase [SAR202 cluster bacterium]|nr:RluA family pseudouridine synthase [SAR202 cluster bacterium]
MTTEPGELTVTHGGARLDIFLSTAGIGLTRAQAQKAIRAGRVTVDGVAVQKPAMSLSPGARVRVVAGELSAGPRAQIPSPVRVVIEDEWMLVVDKPAGLPVHAGAGHSGDTLVDVLLQMRPEITGAGPDPERPGIVHRLDKDTSGLIAVAKTAESAELLAASIRGRTILRRYTALVVGRLVPEGGVIDAPVGRHPGQRQRQAITTTGRPARTGYRVIRYLPTTTLVLCTLQTGRMHQIRVHMAGLGFPIVGDPVYGRPGYGLRRQFLHASYLAFDHPFTGERFECESPLPDDLAAALARAEKEM